MKSDTAAKTTAGKPGEERNKLPTELDGHEPLRRPVRVVECWRVQAALAHEPNTNTTVGGKNRLSSIGIVRKTENLDVQSTPIGNSCKESTGSSRGTEAHKRGEDTRNQRQKFGPVTTSWPNNHSPRHSVLFFYSGRATFNRRGREPNPRPSKHHSSHNS